MNIYLQNINTIKNINFLNNNRTYTGNNLSPLTQDTVSFGTGLSNDVNVSLAKKTIAEFQNTDFKASGQHNLTLSELLNVCKYCGCTLEKGGSHQYHLRTPLGQSYPIATHSSIHKNPNQEAKVSFAADVITAIKNLDENNGEIIFPQLRDSSTVTKDSGISHSEQRNLYKEELMGKRTEEEKLKRAEEAKKYAETEKLSDKKRNEIRTLQSTISQKVSYLETTKESYYSLRDLAIELLEHEFVQFDNEVMSEEKETTIKKIKEQLDAEIEKHVLIITEIIEDAKYNDDDSKDILEAKLQQVIDNIEIADKATLENEESIFKILSENIHMNKFQEKYNGLTRIEQLFKQLQTSRKEFKRIIKERKEEKKYTDESKSLAKKRDELRDLKTAVINNEITVDEAIKRAKEIVDEGENILLEFLDKINETNKDSHTYNIEEATKERVDALIEKIDTILSSSQTKIENITSLLEEIKDSCSKEEYEHIETGINSLKEKIANSKIKKIRALLESKKVSDYVLKNKDGYINFEKKSISSEIDKITEEINKIKHGISESKSEETSSQVVKKAEEEISEEIAVPSIEEESEQKKTTEHIADVPANIFDIISSKVSMAPSITEDKAEETEEISEVTQTDEEKAEPAEQVITSETPTPLQKDDNETSAKKSTVRSAKTEQPKNNTGIQNSGTQKVGLTKNSEKPFENELIDKISRKVAVLNMRPLINDINREVKKCFTNQEISELQNASVEEYASIMRNKIKEISSNESIRELKRAATFAILKDIEIVKPSEAEKIYKKEPSEVNNVLKQISENNRYESYKPNYNNLSSIYKEYAQSPKNPQTVAEFIANGLDMNENEQQKLQNSIKENNLNYIKEITENSTSKGLRTLIIKAVLNNYDKKYNTEYTTKADSVIENYENKKTNEEKLKMLDNFDWNFDSLF